MRVSIDTFDPGEIRTAIDAGAELVLSVNARNLEVARELAGARRAHGRHPGLGGALDTLAPQHRGARCVGRVGYLIDPVIEPIGFGFTASLERYAEVRRRYPDAPR